MAKNAKGKQTEFSVVSEGVLPKARAARCGYEWKRIESSWTRLLAPYIKQK
jgi:hypothetical protein